MKRILILLIVLSICLLTACGSPSNKELDTESPEAETSSACVSAYSTFSSPNNGAKVGIEPPFYYVVVEDLHEKMATAEDGTVLVSHQYQLPTLHVRDKDGMDLADSSDPAIQKAIKIATSFNDGTAALLAKSDYDSFVDMAKEDYTSQMEEETNWFSPYTDEMNYSVYQTDHFISVLATYHWYTGGAHGHSNNDSYNFDLKNGTFFAPLSFTDHPQIMKEAVTAKLKELAKERASEYDMTPEAFFFDGYEEVLRHWEDYTVYFTEEGCHVIFPSYDIACYAAGPQDFMLSIEFLQPYLNDYGRTMLGLPEKNEG